MLFQDDISRLCLGVNSAQFSNNLMDVVMESKFLDFNIDKSCFLVIGSAKARKQIKEQLMETPLTLSGYPMKEVQCEKWLGDYIHIEGNNRSIIETIKKRYGLAMIWIWISNAFLMITESTLLVV